MEDENNPYASAIEDTSGGSPDWFNELWSDSNIMKNAQAIFEGINDTQQFTPVTDPKNTEGGDVMKSISDNIHYNLNDFSKYGSIGEYMKRIFKAEAGGKVNAKNPYASAAGPYQFIKSTWTNLCKKYGRNYTLDDRYDMGKASDIMRLMTEDNRRILKKQLGREPGMGELYLAHFLGIGGAQQALRADKNASILSIMSAKTADINKVYTKSGKNYITIGEMMMRLGRKMS